MKLGTKINQTWHRIERGQYERLTCGIRFVVEYDAEYRHWNCRRDSKLFETANTLREAKSYCIELAEQR